MAYKSLTDFDPEFNNVNQEEYLSEALTLIRLRSAFILWAFGIFFSIVLFIFENFYHEAQIEANF
jgi:hypothetical protein